MSASTPSAAGEGRATFAALLLALAALTAYRLAARALAGVELYFDEAQYYAWSLAPDFGYFSKPPLVAWTIAAARAVCGDGEACIRAPAFIAFAVATLAVYALGRRLFDERTALWAALLLLLAPITSLLSWFITTDSLLIAAWALALYAFARALQGGGLRWWLACGLAGGIGLLAKYTMGIFAVSAAGFLLGSPRHRPLLATPGPWLGAAVAAALFAPNVWWNVQHDFATVGHTAHISQLGVAGVSVLRGLRFLAEQLAVFGPLSFVAFALALWAGRHGDWRQSLLAWFALPFLLLITAQAFAARAHANWAAPTYVAASLLAAHWLRSRATPRLLIAALAVNVLIMFAVYHYRPLAAAAGISLPARLDPLQQLTGWAPLGRHVAAQLQQQRARLLVEDRRLMSWMIYYAGPAAHDALAWNPGRRVDNHYRLLRDVAQSPRGPFLFVSEVDREADLRAQFDAVQPLGSLMAPGCASPCERRLLAWRLGDFRGYPR
ncbi:MAG: glycosyltransferase family 39 protein [Burkholderiaceae bacterium]|nr:glycosyltransferase family 39 protein [Burkholderiaceae bacterium]